MSAMEFCPRGGMEGIYVSTSELEWFAKNQTKSKYIDSHIPLPGVDPRKQLSAMKTCNKDHDGFDDAVYWETDKGSHGWCCSNCGLVIQWG